MIEELKKPDPDGKHYTCLACGTRTSGPKYMLEDERAEDVVRLGHMLEINGIAGLLAMVSEAVQARPAYEDL